MRFCCHIVSFGRLGWGDFLNDQKQRCPSKLRALSEKTAKKEFEKIEGCYRTCRAIFCKEGAGAYIVN